jgi:hypothetical protein
MSGYADVALTYSASVDPMSFHSILELKRPYGQLYRTAGDAVKDQLLGEVMSLGTMKESSDIICGGITDLFTINVLAKVGSEYYMTSSVRDPRSYILHVLLLTQNLNSHENLIRQRAGELIKVDDDAAPQPPELNKSAKRKGTGKETKTLKRSKIGKGDENCDCINISNDRYEDYLSDLDYLRTIELRKLGTRYLTAELLRTLG